MDSFQHPDETHQVDRPFKSNYRREYDRVYAWVQARRSSILRYFGIAGGVIAGIVLLSAVGIYGLGWQNTFSYGVSHVLPFPAAVVDGDMVWYKDYFEQTEYFNGVSAYKNTQTTRLSRHETRKQALEAAVAQEVLEHHAREQGLTVTSSEVDQRFGSMFANQEEEKQFIKTPGISEELVRQHIETQLLLHKLEQKLAQNNELGGRSSMEWINQQIETAEVTYLLPQLKG